MFSEQVIAGNGSMLNSLLGDSQSSNILRVLEILQ